MSTCFFFLEKSAKFVFILVKSAKFKQDWKNLIFYLLKFSNIEFVPSGRIIIKKLAELYTLSIRSGKYSFDLHDKSSGNAPSS